jgi:Holliday junction resolvasome RuvABC endonuclease subunit
MSIISVDSSTLSLAFAIWDKGLEAYGKILFRQDSKNIYDKAGVIGKRSGASLSKLIEVYKIKNMVIEKPIFANSPMTASNLALAQGALVGASIFAGIESVVGVEPITWAAHIGNANLNKKEKEQIKLDNPNASPNQLKVMQRDFRKQRTMDYVNKRFTLNIRDNDIGDAIAIGAYALDKKLF